MDADRTDRPAQAHARERLLPLLADGAWHSGDRLAATLGVSRTAVWKAVRALARRGVGIERARGRGYRLGRPLDPLEPRALERLFRALAGPDARVEIRDVVTSTNDLAREAAGGPPLLVSAEYQQGGRGRRGRRWWSPYGAGLCVSFGFALTPGPGGVAALPLVCALGVVEGLRAATGATPGIKWPNDIEWEGRKLGGILVEVQGETHGPLWTVVGLGLNVHRGRDGWPEDVGGRLAALDDLRPAAPWKRGDILAAVLASLWPRLRAFAREGFAPVREAYTRHDVLRGRRVVVLQDGAPPLEGTALGTDDEGRLRLLAADGERRLGVGEVSVRGS